MAKSVQFRSLNEQQGFTMIPNCLLFDPGVSDTALRLYAMFVYFARAEDSCFPGQGGLGRMLGVSDRQVRRLVDELVEVSLVEVERRGNRRTNLYWLLPLDNYVGNPVEKVVELFPDRTLMSGSDRTKMSAPLIGKKTQVKKKELSELGEPRKPVGKRRKVDPTQLDPARMLTDLTRRYGNR